MCSKTNALGVKNIIFDAHQDILWYEQNNKNKTQTSFAKIIKSNIKLVVASVFITPDEKDVANSNVELQKVETQIDDYLKIIEENENLSLIKEKNDIKNVLNSDKTGVLIHIEGLDFLNEKNFGVLDKFYKRGLRSVGLVWGSKNNIASDSNHAGGLTSFGEKLIFKLNKLGIIVDLAHANKESFFDVLKVSQTAVMVSHSNVYALCSLKRNLKDGQIKMLNKKGGVVGVFFSKKYIDSSLIGSIDSAVEHFKYLYSIAPNAVMIGSDFGGITSGVLSGLESIDNYDNLISKLEETLSKTAVRKIAYKNFLSFLNKVLK